jgi:hypothetical protein
MMQTIGTVLDAANGQERRAVVQQLFDRVWLERGKITAVRPAPSFMSLVEATMRMWVWRSRLGSNQRLKLGPPV